MAEQESRVVTDDELRAAMKSCAHKGEGCCADRPETLIGARHGVGDKFISESSMVVVNAAFHAGAHGIPLDQMTFHEPVLRDLAPEEAEGLHNISIVEPGEERVLADAMRADSLHRQVGNCAYKCGQFADCPLKAFQQ